MSYESSSFDPDQPHQTPAYQQSMDLTFQERRAFVTELLPCLKDESFLNIEVNAGSRGIYDVTYLNYLTTNMPEGGQRVQISFYEQVGRDKQLFSQWSQDFMPEGPIPQIRRGEAQLISDAWHMANVVTRPRTFVDFSPNYFAPDGASDIARRLIIPAFDSLIRMEEGVNLGESLQNSVRVSYETRTETASYRLERGNLSDDDSLDDANISTVTYHVQDVVASLDDPNMSNVETVMSRCIAGDSRLSRSLIEEGIDSGLVTFSREHNYIYNHDSGEVTHMAIDQSYVGRGVYEYVSEERKLLGGLVYHDLLPSSKFGLRDNARSNTGGSISYKDWRALRPYDPNLVGPEDTRRVERAMHMLRFAGLGVVPKPK